jgi:hypothetical protein
MFLNFPIQFFTEQFINDLERVSQVRLEIVKDGNAESILEGITDGYTVDQAATSEVFWLTKVLGDYNINKIGDTFVFNNGQRSMLLKRI